MMGAFGNWSGYTKQPSQLPK